jgi:Regulator of chromosome condensation (RCC1) repeat
MENSTSCNESLYAWGSGSHGQLGVAHLWDGPVSAQYDEFDLCIPVQVPFPPAFLLSPQPQQQKDDTVRKGHAAEPPPAVTVTIGTGKGVDVVAKEQTQEEQTHTEEQKQKQKQSAHRTPEKTSSTRVSLRFAQVVGGGSHTLALTHNGECFVWGNNERGQLGLSGHGPPLQREGNAALESERVVVATEDVVTVACSFAESKVYSPRRLRPFSCAHIVKLAAGWNHSLALTGLCLPFSSYASVCRVRLCLCLVCLL